MYNNKEECVCRTNELNNVISEASAQNFSACEELRLKINELENRLCGIDYLINEKFNELTQDFNVFKNDTFAAFENERNKYNELKTDYENRISELTNNIDEKYRVTINSLKKDFEKEIAALKEQTKSPLVKLKEKIKGHN